MKKIKKNEFTEKFRKEKIDRTQMNFLVGGDGDGGQTAPPDPWG